MKSPDVDKWIIAMQEEHRSIQDANVWEVHNMEDLPIGRKGIGSRWVYKVKLNADGSIERFKAWLVVKGYSQISGIDYDETFAPVTRYDSFRLITALAALYNLELAQADVKSAFLYGELKEEIWMLPPPGIGLQGKILRLKKALYGLKQAPNEWYEKLSSVLAEQGFISTHFDPCVFISTSTATIVEVYVDDISIAGTRNDIENLFTFLKQYFQSTIKPKLQWILGMEVNQTERAITLSQEQFINKILERFGLSDCRPVLTPLDPKCHLTKADPTSEPILNPTLYQQMIGSLMYLVTCTRPDLAFSVSFLSQFSVHPVQRHHTAVKRVFRYLQGTRQLKLVYPRNGKLELTGYSDASYANCPDTRRSYSGYTFFLGDCAISWMSKKQQSVSTSTTEAEYMALP
jgi:hypothetical protein